MNALRVLGMLALTAVVACGPSAEETSQPTTDLEALLADQTAINEDLARRIDALEQQLALEGPSAGLGGPADIEELTAQLNDLDESITRIDDEVAAERDARLDLGVLLNDFERDVRDSIADLRDTSGELRALIQDLEIRYQILQQRIDQMQQ